MLNLLSFTVVRNGLISFTASQQCSIRFPLSLLSLFSLMIDTNWFWLLPLSGGDSAVACNKNLEFQSKFHKWSPEKHVPATQQRAVASTICHTIVAVQHRNHQVVE